VPPDAWDRPSLCEGWRVHDVLAHLTMPFSVSTPQFVVGMLANLGNYDRFTARWARIEAAAKGPAELLDIVRRNAESHFTPPGYGPEAPLTDTVVHGFDLCVPLGVHLEHPHGEARRAVLDFLVSSKAGKVFRAGDVRLAGVCLEATDLAWTAGDGEPVRGSSEALILWLTGRGPRPSGDGG
jgi:uncharacterized protein (TIGR03083 family)